MCKRAQGADGQPIADVGLALCEPRSFHLHPLHYY